ncbi:Cystathionine beta-lyase [Pseudomonas reidholzensis]|uniref:Cystathionine beta-lyase n=1 Tax=Pseudomonas reidholzensis TaxID=1785162 RepID=A0A383RSJ4_9PSED|nr:cystathionine beta-lyase [Pseudomonas reidholzensis]SYX90047.1 Cystathionine beta-lyase [Pseudomonas reidholzensis]
MSPRITPAHLHDWLFDGQEIALFDVREHGQYGEAHLFHGVNLPYSRLEIDAPRLAPNRAVRVVVYDEDGGALAVRALQRLQALGYSAVHWLEGGARGWQAAGHELFAGVHLPSKAFGELVEHACHTPRVSAEQLAIWQRQGKPLVVLDGRPLDEFAKMSIPGATCCPNGELGYRFEDLVADPQTPVVINCAGRTRSIIGAQTLINLGVENPVYALENGTQGWYLVDLPLDHGSLQGYPAHSGRALDQQRNRAERLARQAGVQWVDAQQVIDWNNATEGQPRSLYLCDVRTPEEFASGSLAGAQHCPGGQLVQGTDLYIGVRHARVVLFDNDGVRAPVVASWLRQMGHQAYVLKDALASGVGLAPPQPVAVTLAEAQSSELDGAQLIDLRASSAYRKRHLRGAKWSSRVRLAEQVSGSRQRLVFIADDPQVAELAVSELPSQQRESARLFPQAALGDWPQVDNDFSLADADCIDFLFFVHDRHAGNKDAARQYLAWETGLIAQMSDAEINSFSPLSADQGLATRLLHAGRNPAGQGAQGVNVPVSRLSTVLFDSVEQMRDARSRRDHERVLSYGARGNPTAFALEDLVSELEGGYRSKLYATGLQAIAQTFLAYLRPGDHLLVSDGVYGPVRRLARDLLQPFGVQVEYFAADGQGLAQAFKPNTRMVYSESPSSLLYELNDLPAMAALCKARGVLLAVDNTWGSGYLYQPLALGADISVMALTKYLGGHSDVMMGSVCTTREVFPALSRMSDTFGCTVSADDAWLVLRGARTLASRMAVHERQGLEIAQWLQRREEVARVFHPALPGHPGHDLWRRDFSGSNGLLSFEFAAPGAARAEAFVNALRLFGIGASWGGYESLVTLADVRERTFAPQHAGALVRLHVGLEDVRALQRDLDQALRIEV